MASVHDVAAYILERGGSMSTMKLQKLVYYCQAWNLVWLEEPLFEAEIQAWLNGPVVYDLYLAHRGRFRVDTWAEGRSSKLSEDEKKTIDAVFDAYGKFSAQQLSSLSHQEAPWIEARDGLAPNMGSSTPLSLETMQQYYSSVAASADSVDL